jgi:uncharacterized protein (TIGR02996 family)
MKSADEKAFLKMIAERPFDAAPRLVYADWLEERGDPRAEDVRTQCRFRVPITATERRHLAAIAAARDRADGEQVAIMVNADAPGHVLANPAAFCADLEHLSRLELARNFPRDEKGRLELRQVVLLSQHACEEDLPRGRDLWLIAKGPDRRSDPQVITVELEPLIGDNHLHNWSHLRWWWDDRAASLDDFARWGVTAAALCEVTGPHRSAAVRKLETRRASEKLNSAEKIALCTAWQDDGRFEDAMKLYEIEYAEEISRMLNGEAFVLRNGCCEPGNEKSANLRGQRMRFALWQSAPWRFSAALGDAQQRLDDWRRARPGRPRKTPQLRFFILPGSSHHSRKPGLMLVPGKDGKPCLDFVFTAANVALPESAWTRPIELDIVRFGPANE